MPLVSATTIKLLLVGPVTITGSVDAIDPPDADGMNASYSWQPGQTATAGSYRGEIEITWSTISSPQAVETVPNSGTFNLVIEGDLG